MGIQNLIKNEIPGSDIPLPDNNATVVCFACSVITHYQLSYNDLEPYYSGYFHQLSIENYNGRFLIAVPYTNIMYTFYIFYFGWALPTL